MKSSKGSPGRSGTGEVAPALRARIDRDNGATQGPTVARSRTEGKFVYNLAYLLCGALTSTRSCELHLSRTTTGTYITQSSGMKRLQCTIMSNVLFSLVLLASGMISVTEMGSLKMAWLGSLCLLICFTQPDRIDAMLYGRREHHRIRSNNALPPGAGTSFPSSTSADLFTRHRFKQHPRALRTGQYQRFWAWRIKTMLGDDMYRRSCVHAEGTCRSSQLRRQRGGWYVLGVGCPDHQSVTCSTRPGQWTFTMMDACAVAVSYLDRWMLNSEGR